MMTTLGGRLPAAAARWAGLSLVLLYVLMIGAPPPAVRSAVMIGAQTVAFALLGAFLLSLTYIPMMSAWVLDKHPHHATTFADRMMARRGFTARP